MADPEGWLEVEFARGVYDLGASMARTEPEYLPNFADTVLLGEELHTMVFEVDRGVELELQLGGEKGRKNSQKKKRWPNLRTIARCRCRY